MPVARLKVETDYLRAFVTNYWSEIAFDPVAESQMRQQEINLAEVNSALRNAEVVSSEKEDACGAMWIVEGETCDGDHLAISMEALVDRYHLCIKGIEKLARS